MSAAASTDPYRPNAIQRANRALVRAVVGAGRETGRRVGLAWRRYCSPGEWRVPDGSPLIPLLCLCIVPWVLLIPVAVPLLAVFGDGIPYAWRKLKAILFGRGPIFPPPAHRPPEP